MPRSTSTEVYSTRFTWTFSPQRNDDNDAITALDRFQINNYLKSSDTSMHSTYSAKVFFF